jgi:hypothetical protein
VYFLYLLYFINVINLKQLGMAVANELSEIHIKQEFTPTIPPEFALQSGPGGNPKATTAASQTH